MAREETSIEALRERLTGLLADWGAEMSGVLRDLDQARTALEEAQAASSSHDQELKSLRERTEGQEELVEALRAEARDASQLRVEVHEKDLEIERLKSELESKRELIGALRRDAEGLERLKNEAKRKDQEIAGLQAEHRETGQRIEALEAELEALAESSESENSEGLAELEAVRAELEARKTLIKSLRADAERVTALEARLEEKREIIATLEASMNRHGETIAEVRRVADGWKKKYQELRGGKAADTSTQLPAFATTDIAALEQLESTDVASPDHTIAIDMRRPLSEARRRAAQNQEKR